MLYSPENELLVVQYRCDRSMFYPNEGLVVIWTPIFFKCSFYTDSPPSGSGRLVLLRRSVAKFGAIFRTTLTVPNTDTHRISKLTVPNTHRNYFMVFGVGRSTMALIRSSPFGWQYMTGVFSFFWAKLDYRGFKYASCVAQQAIRSPMYYTRSLLRWWKLANARAIFITRWKIQGALAMPCHVEDVWTRTSFLFAWRVLSCRFHFLPREFSISFKFFGRRKLWCTWYHQLRRCVLQCLAFTTSFESDVSLSFICSLRRI